MAALQLVLIQLCISLSLVVCNSIEKRAPRPLLLEDPAGNYSLLNDTTTEGRSKGVPNPPFASNSIQIENNKNSSDMRNGTGSSTRNQEFVRRIRAGMYIPIGSNHSLAAFLMKIQHAVVCPDKKHCKMENVTEPFVPYLPEDGLFCTDREWLSPDDNQLVIYTLHFRLIPGVCFTRSQHLSFCDKPKIIFPTESQCVSFFRGEDCSGGEMVTIYSGGLDMLENAIVGSKSFAFC